jgi:hypothetical protein
MPLTYAPFGETLDVPNVVVDGSANRATVLTLSHWPGTDCPRELQADLSAEMAFRYLDEGAQRHGDAAVVTDNHFDEDGVVAMFALVDPRSALAQRELLVDVARAGDFGWFHDRRAARMSMVVDAWGSRLDSVSAYRHTLPRLGTLAAEIDDHRDLWAEEDDRLTASERAIDGGEIHIEQHADVDLAVVTSRRAEAPHEMAIHNRTPHLRVAQVRGRHLELVYRYETWVRLRSRTPMPRVDLSGPRRAPHRSRTRRGAVARGSGRRAHPALGAGVRVRKRPPTGDVRVRGAPVAHRRDLHLVPVRPLKRRSAGASCPIA